MDTSTILHCYSKLPGEYLVLREHVVTNRNHENFVEISELGNSHFYTIEQYVNVENSSAMDYSWLKDNQHVAETEYFEMVKSMGFDKPGSKKEFQ